MYNNSMTEATGMSPFYANYGYNPKVRWLRQAEAKNPAATLYAHWMEEVHQRCKEQLKKTRDRMSKYFDSHRIPAPSFKPGDEVLLDGRNLATKRSSKKLSHKLEGPFPIIELIGNRAARLQLPKTMKCHNVFHVALLEPYHKSTIEGRRQARPDPVIVDGEKEYEIEHVIRSEIRKPKKGKKWWVNYLVKWKDYPPGESTWENVDAFADGAMHFLRQFHLDHPDAPMDPSLRGKDLAKASDWDEDDDRDTNDVNTDA